MNVKLISVTPDAEKMMGYVARVSNPSNQENPKVAGLLKYCVKHQHWSVFEQSFMTLEIETTRGLAAQILRHRSFTFQQFSGRYQDQKELTLMTEGLPTCEHDLFYMPVQARMQDTKNRQNSIETDDELVTKKMQGTINDCLLACYKAYNKLLEQGIAKEVARFVLPQGTYTRLYVTGSPRSFIHYIGVRDDAGVAQLEHVELAQAIKQVFTAECPIISEAVWG